MAVRITWNEELLWKARNRLAEVEAMDTTDEARGHWLQAVEHLKEIVMVLERKVAAEARVS